MNIISAFVALVVFLMAISSAHAQAAPPDNHSTVNPEALKRWRDARFGMFIHWGPVSLTGKEIGWSRGSETPIAKYDNLYKDFNPENFNADKWVEIAKVAGMKYIVLTTKHHDGFCLWNTRETDYNIMATPFKRDVVKELAEACRKQGIAFGVYYSVADWHHPDFIYTSPRGKVTRQMHNMDKYEAYLNAQVRELLTQYGDIFTLWFDVPSGYGDTRGQRTNNQARSLAPNLLINNRASSGVPGDYDTPEQKLGRFQRDRAWESCMTVSAGNHWAWGGEKDGVKPPEQLIQMVVQGAGNDGNILLNVGPRPTGEIDAAQAEVLKEVGAWMEKYGESIYATRGGPYISGEWGASTCKENAIYVHIAIYDDGNSLTLPPINRKILGSKLLAGGEVDVEQSDKGVKISVPFDNQSAPYTVVKLELDGPAFDILPVNVEPESETK